VAERIVSCFSTLTPTDSKAAVTDRSTKTAFLENFNNVVANIRAFQCIK
jgi:hypothetical protein